MLQRRDWVPAGPETYVQALAQQVARSSPEDTEAALVAAVDENRAIHERQCINLNPATNMMNPKAEALLSAGIGARPSLGYPGDKYEMGLEGIEKIEVMAAELAAEVFNARFAEIRVGSGALANLYVFMAAAKPGDAIIAPPGQIGGHVTHHATGAAGLYGLSRIRPPSRPMATRWMSISFVPMRRGLSLSSSPSAAASISSRTPSPRSAPLRMRSGRLSCSTRRICRA